MRLLTILVLVGSLGAQDPPKAAEQEVLHESGQRKTMEPADREALDREYQRERERLSSEQDAKIEKIRSGRTS